MIRNIEIKEIAREFAVPETTIEKDYALSWILNSLHRHTNSLALKGGTGKNIHQKLPIFRRS